MRGATRVAWLAAGVLLAAVAATACRQDMHNQPKYLPLRDSDFFADGSSARPIPPDTVARGTLEDDEAFYTGKTAGAEVTELPVPLTKAWFLGLANIRGNLFSIIDFPAFLGDAPVCSGSLARLILLSTRGGGESAGLVVESVLGLRNLAQFEPAASDDSPPSWQLAVWRDGDGASWQEIDLGLLARDPAFLQVGA